MTINDLVLTNNVKKPTILYHASHISNLKELHSIHNISNSGSSLGKKWIYAATSRNVCSAFTFPWDDSFGIEFSSHIYTSANSKIWKGIFKIPKKLSHLMNHPCSIYTITDVSTFSPVTSGLHGEYRSISATIPVHSEIKFPTAKKCMESYGVNIVIV